MEMRRTLRKRNEEIINMIVGSKSDQYLDYDKDGQIDTQANGYGSLPNGDQAGYLQETALDAQSAADAPDPHRISASKMQSLQICIQNMQDMDKRNTATGIEAARKLHSVRR